MIERIAVVVTASDSDETAAEVILRSFGYHVAVPRSPSLHSITRRVPDLVVIDWWPGKIELNSALVQDMRANAVLEEVPILVLHSEERDVPEALLKVDRLVALRIPVTSDIFRRALERLGALEAQKSDPDIPPPGRAFPWDLIHPSVRNEARGRFDAGQFADGVEAAFKAINSRVKRVWLASGQTEKDGKSLMLSAFSPKTPTIRLSDLSMESGRNVQEGYMHLFAGAMQGVRNPNAHDNVIMPIERAWHLVTLASLLMWTLDGAGG